MSWRTPISNNRRHVAVCMALQIITWRATRINNIKNKNVIRCSDKENHLSLKYLKTREYLKMHLHERLESSYSPHKFRRGFSKRTTRGKREICNHQRMYWNEESKRRKLD